MSDNLHLQTTSPVILSGRKIWETWQSPITTLVLGDEETKAWWQTYGTRVAAGCLLSLKPLRGSPWWVKKLLGILQLASGSVRTRTRVSYLQPGLCTKIFVLLILRHFFTHSPIHLFNKPEQEKGNAFGEVCSWQQKQYSIIARVTLPPRTFGLQTFWGWMSERVEGKCYTKTG